MNDNVESNKIKMVKEWKFYKTQTFEQLNPRTRLNFGSGGDDNDDDDDYDDDDDDDDDDEKKNMK